MNFLKSINRKNLKWILVIIFMIFLFLISINILRQRSFWFDDDIFLFLRSFESKNVTHFFKFVTDFVSIPALFLFCILVYLIPGTRKQGNLVIFNLGVVTLINLILKNIFVRSRPLGIALIKESGYSFPSGHSMTSLAYFGLFIYLIYCSNLSKKKKVFLITLLCFLIFLIGISRIYLGVHYASDVIGGFILSIVYLVIFTHILNLKQRKKCEE